MRRQDKQERKWSASRRLRSALICGGIAAIVSGCAQPQPAGTLAQICGERGWREIGIRKRDVITPETGKEIVGSNEARATWCGKIAEAKK